jgi:uncharacterized membrane protein
MNIEQLLLGLSLASAAGLRAFLPLLLLSLMARFGHLPLNEHFAWVGSNAALAVLSIATVVELLSDKVPVVDHALDAVQTVVRPLAGALAVASSQSHMDPTMAAVLALLLGAPTAGGIHFAKGSARLMSTAGTAGLANPFISIGEDFLALALSALGIFIPFVGFAISLIFAYLAYRGWRAWQKRRTSRPVQPPVQDS